MRFVILHFTDVNLPANNRLEVDLGYGTDSFTAASGTDFWTRPINVPPAGVPIRYVVDGASSGGATLSQVGLGEEVTTGTPGTATGNRTNPDLFLQTSPYVEPMYETRGICGPVDWANVACLPSESIREEVAAVTCILVMVHGGHVTSCSGALIDDDLLTDNDLILTARHCFDSSEQIEVASGSVTFDYLTECSGARPPGLSPRFHKIKRLVQLGGALDYALVQIETPPSGLGITPRSMRPSLPSLGEDVFLIHHPNGAVKKITSGPGRPPVQILSVSGDEVRMDGDLAGGSSGSPLFDMDGNVIGVNVTAPDPCSHGTLPTARILQDLAGAPPPSAGRDVMIVLDRSGSMSLPGSAAGATKIEEARDAAALFIELIRAGAGHQVGVASFSTTASSPVDFALAGVSAATKTNLIGPPPHTGGIVGGLTPEGTTTIGGGLQAGQTNLVASGLEINKPFILLLTDGLQNTPPMIADVEPLLADTELCIVGFGNEASLDGRILSRLAADHRGLYTRAGTGLALKKFFVLCFGNIFENGSSLDPEFFLPASQQAAEPVPVVVCGEDVLTVVLGWDTPSASLALRLRTPGGTTVDNQTAGIESGRGRTWAYLRVPLPLGGERDGTWQIEVERAGGGDPEFPPPAVDVTYFLASVVAGGAALTPVDVPPRLYTGDVVNPKVSLRQSDGTRPEAEIILDISRPTVGTGNLLTESGLQVPTNVDGDLLNARTTTLLSLEAAAPDDLVPTTSQTFPLYDDGAHDDGAMEPDGIYGNPLSDLTRHEGTYTFHARATYGGVACVASRETMWSIRIEVAIDPDRTGITTEVVGRLPDGRRRVRVIITPQDRYGNHLGPGEVEAFTVAGQAGSEPTGPIRDRGDGSYEVEVAWDPESGGPPSILVSQPDRSPVPVSEELPGTTERGLPWKLLALLLFVAVIVLLLGLIRAGRRIRKLQHRVRQTWYPWARLRRS